MTDQYEKIANERITALETENARLTAERDNAQGCFKQAWNEAVNYKQERDALATRCRELEAVLDSARDFIPTGSAEYARILALDAQSSKPSPARR